MGNSGEKRKGRKHLPKVGTPAEEHCAIHRERQAVEENLGLGPEACRRRSSVRC